MQYLHVVISGGKLRTEAHGCTESRAQSTRRLLESAFGTLRLRDAEFAINTGDDPGQIGDYTTFSYTSDTADVSLACPDFVFGGYPELGISDYATACSNISACGAHAPLFAKLGWCDAPTTAPHEKLVQLADAHPHMVEMVRETPGVSSLTLDEQVRRWKYLIDLPRQGWNGELKLRLWSGRVLFLVERSSREWFSPLLQPWKHYVPVRPDLADIEGNLARLEANPAQQEIIAANAQGFARKHLTREAAVARWRELLESNFSRKASPARTGAAVQSAPAAKPVATPVSASTAALASTPATRESSSHAAAAHLVEPADVPTFVIVSPAYIGHSAGVSLLHRLCHTINGLGFRAYMMVLAKNSAGRVHVGFGVEKAVNPAWNTPLFTPAQMPLLRHAYVIYPEGIVGNPLNSQRVIRYFLNRESYFGDPKVAVHSDDFLVAFHRIFRPEAHHLLSDFPINPLFNNENTRPAIERTLDITYIGKGEFDGPVRVVEKTLYVARHWPMNQEQVAMVLKQARYVFTWDPMSAFNVEALLCGAQPVLMRHGRWTREELAGTQLGRIPWIDPSEPFQRYPKFDQATLDRERERILSAMKEHGADWNGRVKGMVEHAIRHFAERSGSAGSAVAA